MDNERAETAVCRSTVYFPLYTLSAAGRAPPPPSGLFGEIWGQAEAMDNEQWTVDNE
jgi:hypothetical protein